MSMFDNLTPRGPTPPSDLWLTVPQVIAGMAKEGDPVPSGLPWLDSRLRRGGLTPGRVYAFGGPPFTGKTTIVVDIALGLARRIPVFALFSDEGRAQAAARMGVMIGVDLERIETDPSKAAPQIEDYMGERALYLAKPDSEIANAEAIFDAVAARVPKGETAAVILDSVQTIPPDDEDETSASERERILRFAKTVRERAESDGRIVILTSQANRAWYRNRKTDENSVAMTGFAGAAIEFSFDFGLMLYLPHEQNELVKADVVKNRVGHFKNPPPKSFHVRYCPDSGRMLEVDPAAVEEAGQEAARARLRPVEQQVLLVLRNSSEGLTRLQIGEMTRKRKADLLGALDSLVSQKLIYSKRDGRQVVYAAVEGRN